MGADTGKVGGWEKEACWSEGVPGGEGGEVRRDIWELLRMTWGWVER